MTRMTGSEFESMVATLLSGEKKRENAHFVRYGVQCVHLGKKVIPMKSLPDFEGIIEGEQFIFDCKVCSQASFNLGPYRDKKRRQLQHMIERARYGSHCGFLIHWNERQLKSKSEPAETYWFPVSHDYYEFWERFEAGEIKRITRNDCYRLGIKLSWVSSRPDLMRVFKQVGALDDKD